ncbi:FG-GAP-like repeat-containing protein [Methylobacter psychrophilus]|uniref:FG-GAP-like repeat-containing protein n=1 Tax=Methylobacter psychrophilus TaxID=96941 RepID=UPI0021D4C05D|nr:FG-GAP-like repeat-containing protein [Methylobacter psychrophilus]
MLPTFIANKFGILFFVFFIAIIGLIIYRTPVLIPVGFPYAAKTIYSDQLVQKKQPLNVIFVDRTLEKGLNFSHQQGDEQLAGIDDSLGSGACAADFNNDGWIDLFLVNGSGHTRYYGQQYWWQSFKGNALFLNESGQGFREATSASGLHKKIWGMGCLTGDFDNDGDADLLVTGKESRLLYKNKGDGTFTDITMESGLASQFWSTSTAAADFNGDGLLDIYIGNFIDFKKGQKTFEANSQFTGDKKNTFDSSLYAAQPNQLYLNLGGLKFKEIAAQVGVINPDGRMLDVSWQDINGDALPDLLVTNDRGTGSNMAYLNNDGKYFEPVSQALGLRSALGNRGIASGDLDNDGDIDFVLASTPGESTIALIQEPGVGGKNTSLAHYKDHAREMGIGGNQFLNLSAWTTLIQDFNNDGFNDVFISAGQLEPDPDAAKVSQGQLKQLLLNTGNGYFTDITVSAGIALQDMQSARGSVSADFDNDGDIDLYIAHNNDLGQYLVNESPKKHWLGLKLIGTKSNRDAVGAVVQLTTTNGQQIRSVVSGEGFLSDSDKRIIFGLGDEDKIDQLIINWPGGRKQTIKSIPVDRYWLIEENNNKIDELPVTSAVNTPSQYLRLKLGVEQAEIRAHYISMLGQSKHPDQILPELLIAAKDNNALVRREVITVVSRINTLQGLSLLIKGLEDKDTANVIAAIQGLQDYEDETSIRWLLRLFSHKDPAVKIALADCFGFFFQEEEAVVNRKYLAVPYLIRLLDDTEPMVRISAARALANAERFRGVHSLLDHLNDADLSVRAEMVRTLGLIRQTKALPQLTHLLSDDTQSAVVIANSFIALKRLGDETILKTLESFVIGDDKFDTIPVEKRLDVLADLLAQGDDVGLFDAEQLNGLAHRAFDQFSPNTESTTKSTNLTGRWIAIRQHMKDQASIDWLSRQTQSSQESVRASAFQALFSLKSADRSSILHKALQDKDLSINQWEIEALLDEKNRLSREDYRKILANPQFRSIAMRSWSKADFLTEPSMLVNALNSVLLSGTDVENNYLRRNKHSKSNQGLVVRKIPGKPLNQQLTDLEQLCFSANIELQDFCPMILFSKNTPEHHRVALKLLNNPVYSITIRQAVLNHYGIDFDKDAINTLFTLAQAKKDPLRNSVIRKLLSFNDDSLLEFANKLAGNVAEDSDVRFQAVEFMMRQGHPEAQEILYR